MTAANLPHRTPHNRQHATRVPIDPKGAERAGASGKLPVDDEDAPLYSTGQVAAMLGVRQAFLRRLDDQQIVRPRRSAGGQRRYSRREIERIRQVMAMMNEGVALAAVRRILHLQQQLADTRRQLADLRRRLQGRAEGPGDGQTRRSQPQSR